MNLKQLDNLSAIVHNEMLMIVNIHRCGSDYFMLISDHEDNQLLEITLHENGSTTDKVKVKFDA